MFEIAFCSFLVSCGPSLSVWYSRFSMCGLFEGHICTLLVRYVDYNLHANTVVSGGRSLAMDGCLRRRCF